MGVKDYYKLLEIKPDASVQEIKRSYRRLAQRYHPDKNPENPAAESFFKEVVEAYKILSDPKEREQYNYRRWHLRQTGKKYDTQSYSPQSILIQATSLREYVAGIDVFRMNQDALHHQLDEILSIQHLSILRQTNEIKMNRAIIHELLLAATPLEWIYAHAICKKMTTLASDDTHSLEMIETFLEQHRKVHLWNKYKLLWTLLAVLILCLLIYFLGNRS